MAQIIPTRQDAAHYQFPVELEGVVFGLEFYWNARDASWYLTILDAEGVPLLSSRKLVLDLPLTARYRDLRLPRGEFVVLDTTGQGLEAGLKDLGTRVLLVYVPSTELPPEFVAA